ncbi:MAG: XdhC family protein, partial [Steroidobacteraceae bacterium]
MTDLHSFFVERCARSESLVLATVVHTAGSTYRKAGAQMLIAADGSAAGLLSGGCLESDLIARAERVLQTRVAEVVRYDTRSEDDLIWGIGLGCEGAMSILLTPLHADNGYQPFAFVDTTRAARKQAAIALVIRASSQLALGQAFAVSADRRTLQALHGGTELRVDGPMDSADALRFPSPRIFSVGEAELLMIPIELSVKLLIAGAGPDVQPLAYIAT